MKKVSEMSIDEKKFLSFLIEDSLTWWECEKEAFKNVFGDIDEIEWLMDVYGTWPDFEVKKYKYNDDKSNCFLSALEEKRITLKDWVDEDSALEEYMKGTNGIFLEMINEVKW